MTVRGCVLAAVRGQLSAEELRRDFAFVGGDIKRVERYRKQPRTAPASSRPLFSHTVDRGGSTGVQVTPPAPREAAPPVVQRPGDEADRAKADALSDEGEDVQLAAAIATLEAKKAALAAKKRELAERSDGIAAKLRGGAHAQPEAEPEVEPEVEQTAVAASGGPVRSAKVREPARADRVRAWVRACLLCQRTHTDTRREKERERERERLTDRQSERGRERERESRSATERPCAADDGHGACFARS